MLELALKQTDLEGLQVLLDPPVSLPHILQPPKELVLRAGGQHHPEVLIH